MLMVPTEIRPSRIHGLGVFLTHAVRQGDLIWQFDSRIDRVYSDDELASLPAHIQAYLHTYCTRHDATGLWVLCGDNARYFNHSPTPSTLSDAISFGSDRAARDLQAGEELTSDYRTICDDIRTNGFAFKPRSSGSLGASVAPAPDTVLSNRHQIAPAAAADSSRSAGTA